MSVIRSRAATAFGAVASLLGALSTGPVRAENPEFHVKPPEVNVAGARPGEVRRTIQPFGAWTLVCDEDLKKRKRICNVSQQIVDASGAVVFSWSLAGTEDGAPVMIVRLAKTEGQLMPVRIAIGTASPAEVQLSSCNDAICLGFLPVTAALRRALGQGGSAQITATIAGRQTTLDAPLNDLMGAIKALK